MIDLKRTQRRFRSVLYSKFTIIALAIVFVFVANSAWQTYKRVRAVAAEHSKSLAELNALQGRKSSLQNDLNSLNTPEGVERQLREKFGVVKNGEEEVVIVNQNSSSTGSASAGAGDWWNNVLHFLHVR